MESYLHKGLSTLVSETGDFVSGNKRLCGRFWQQNRLFPDTKSLVSGDKVAALLPLSATRVDRP